ncbi:hypothetical protein BKH43_02530 [Helicobacter sp. 13S00401-1]|uniref:hypothetical protein n=1 Tax=Helicobacter sp. 13S00401-1 TaxID=1905758 RepID=UPI000BA74ECE|nr:hypothetical protein [Helicobacter sp. 13S00401-1]PAF51101.1 hypothetical protein BKH43_02530 [Helicobacter sp. 13S00401-1]
MYKIVTGLFVIIIFLGGYTLYLFYEKLNPTTTATHSTLALQGKQEASVEVQESSNEPKLDVGDAHGWLARSDLSTSNFQFPINVININISVKKPDEMQVDPTKILIENLDEYKFFYLNEILRLKHIKFSYYKSGDKLALLVSIPNAALRESMLKDFRYYNIKYQINQKL